MGTFKNPDKPPPRRGTAGMSAEDFIPPGLYSFKGEPGSTNGPPEVTRFVPKEDLQSDTDTGETLGLYNRFNNHILLSDKASKLRRYDETLPHEYGHAYWENYMPEWQQNQWTAIHNNMLAKMDKTGGVPDAGEVPSQFKVYENDPSHSFAALYGEYAARPELFQNNYPHLYNYFKALIGREFKTRTPQEASTPAAHIPFSWGTPQ